MASSSSNASTSSSSSTTSTPSAARVLPTRAAAPAASAALGVAHGASASVPNFTPSATAPYAASGATATASASASALNVASVVTASTVLGASRSIPPPPQSPRIRAAWGGSNVPPPTNFFDRGHRRGGRAPNSAGVSRTRNSAQNQNVSRPPSQESGWKTAADTRTSRFTPAKRSTEDSSSSLPSAWSKRPAPPTDTRPASATSSSTTPSPGIKMVPYASCSAPAVVTSAHTAPKLDASTFSAPVVETIVDAALEPDAPTSTLSSAPGVETIVDATAEPVMHESDSGSDPSVLNYRSLELAPLASDETQEGNPVLSSKWPMMLPEILTEIQKYLSPKESARMKVVCKNWYNSTPFYFLADHPMWFVPDSGRMLFGSPVHQRMFSVKQDHQLPSVEYMSASIELVTFIERDSIWVLNVTTGSLNKLPELEKDVHPISQAISWNVVGELFATFTISGYAEEVTISLYWKLTGWVSKKYQCQNPFFPAENSAPVVKGDSVYCLGTDCQIGIFNLETRRWKVQPPRLFWPLLLSDSCHLISTHNAINALIFNNEDCLHPPKVLELDLNRSKWDIIRSLGGQSAFTGGLASSFIKNQGSFMCNRIYLPYSRGQYTLVEASIVVSEGLTLFRVEDKSGANLMFCWYLLDDTNVIQGRPGQPSKRRHRDSFIGDQELPHGTWVNFHRRIGDVEILMAPAGPPTRSNQEQLTGFCRKEV